MTDLSARAHRCSLAVTAVVAVTTVVLLIVLGAAEDATGRGGEPPVGNGKGGVELVAVGGGFEAPVNTAFAPGQENTVYVVEQGGLVRAVAAGSTLTAPFLDLTDQVATGGEQGLLGLAFHPAYETNDLVYAYYTERPSGDIVVSEFDAANPVDADETSRRQVIRIPHRDATNHNGGQLRFGPDGFLYMAPGDGGGAGDPQENAQDRDSLLGKLLRIDPLESGGQPYTVPDDNPYVGRRGRDEIYALGLRNPFRFNFDSQTKRIAIGDVGQARFEEVNIESARSVRGANFGWNRYEGFERFTGGAAKPKRRKHERPVHAYGRSDGRSVVGGLVVRDENLTNLYGRYLFADFFADRLRSFVPSLREVKGRDVKVLKDTGVSFISSFTEDPVTRQVYVTSLGGTVRRLEPEE